MAPQVFGHLGLQSSLARRLAERDTMARSDPCRTWRGHGGQSAQAPAAARLIAEAHVHLSPQVQAGPQAQVFAPGEQVLASWQMQALVRSLSVM